MAFEDFLVALRDNQFGKLRREKPLQPPDAPQFLDLLGDSRFKAAIELRHLVGALAQFANQAGVLHRDHRLCGEVFKQRDFFFRKWPGLPANGDDHPEERIVLTQGDVKQSAVASLNRDAHYIPQFRRDLRQIGNLDKPISLQQPQIGCPGEGW